MRLGFNGPGGVRYDQGEIIPAKIAEGWRHLRSLHSAGIVTPYDDGETGYIVRRPFPGYPIGTVVNREDAETWPNLRFLVAHDYLERHRNQKKRGRPRKEISE